MITYGYWRTDKAREMGYSNELISSHFDKIAHLTDMDNLEAYPPGDIDTILKAFEQNVKRNPHSEFLGTREGDQYRWMSY